MKTTLKLSALALAAIAAALMLGSCTVTTLPDGTQTRAADPAWIELAKIFAEKAIIVEGAK